MIFRCVHVPRVRVGSKALTVAVSSQKLLLGEKILTASACFTHEDMEEVVAALASGLIKVDDLITSTIELKDLIEKGFFALRDDAEHHIKIVVGAFVERKEIEQSCRLTLGLSCVLQISRSLTSRVAV